MSAIQDLFQQAQLAEAAYADFSIPGVSTKDALIANRFSLAQATDLVTNWRVIENGHQPNQASGFSATLFEKIGPDTDPANRFVLALRGTETSFFGDPGLVDLSNQRGQHQLTF
jgi:hypothetical protein